MESITARPDRIIGNVAVASLLAGPPIGVAMSVLGCLLDPSEHSALEWIKNIGGGLFIGPFVLAVGGLVVLAPILSILRYFDCGGPPAVYAITLLFSLFAMSSGPLFGLAVLIFSLPASYVFCRYSY